MTKRGDIVKKIVCFFLASLLLSSGIASAVCVPEKEPFKNYRHRTHWIIEFPEGHSEEIKSIFCNPEGIFNPPWELKPYLDAPRITYYPDGDCDEFLCYNVEHNHWLPIREDDDRF